MDFKWLKIISHGHNNPVVCPWPRRTDSTAPLCTLGSDEWLVAEVDLVVDSSTLPGTGAFLRTETSTSCQMRTENLLQLPQQPAAAYLTGSRAVKSHLQRAVQPWSPCPSAHIRNSKARYCSQLQLCEINAALLHAQSRLRHYEFEGVN